MSRDRIQRKLGGVSAYAIIAPFSAILAMLHLIIIILMMQVNTSSSALSQVMRNTGMYTQDATALLAGSSLLSETSGNYVLMPLTEAGEPNLGPLIGYVQELGEDRRGDQVLERLRGYGLSEASLGQMEIAAQCADAMLTDQLHAIELIRSVYPLPNIPELEALPRAELTAEEQAMSPADREAAARDLILCTDYTQNKKAVSENVNGFVETLQASSGQQQAIFGRRIGKLQTMLWMITIFVMVILSLFFGLFYAQIMQPLRHFVQLLPTNKPLDDKRGFQEVRMVASSYNDVLRRRDALDDILHDAAEKDALTGLQNRFRLQEYLMETENIDEPAAFLVFDVDFLKKTNDTEGHLAGDRLICTSAECISACFGDERCFRFGGDEFVAVIRPGTPEIVEPKINRFKEMQAARKISVSWGCAYTRHLHRADLRVLMDEADQKMYARKKMIHARA